MTAPDSTILIDDVPVPFKPGQTILEAALEAGVFIPHLCFHPELGAHGSCRLCNVIVNGRNISACTMKAASGQEIEVDTWLGESAQAYRRTLVQMLFVEGNHFCPGCEKSGNCQLQALAYDSEMMTPHFVEFYPRRPVDEVGYIPFEPEAANLFFQLVSARYERASLIVTSNKPFGRWGEVFGDDVVAAAMIDRLVHHAEVISLKGDSYRLKNRDLGRIPAASHDHGENP